MKLHGARVYVAGHTGLVGSAVVRALMARSMRPGIIRATHADLDLTRQSDTEAFLAKHRPDVVILAAARVGGIGGQPHAEMLRDNLAIAHNVIEGARAAGCKRLVFLGSSCIYPRLAPQPITEDALLTGPLEPTNRGYAVAKFAGMEMARAYAAAGLLDTLSLMPCNLYGPGDSYDPARSHVLPALIRRFHEAKLTQAPSVTLWGTGAALREFLHVDDLAQAVLRALEGTADAGPLNVGSGEEIPIHALAETVARVVGYDGAIEWDTTKPDGTPRKLLDSSQMRALGWAPRVSLEDGIRSTYASWVAAGTTAPALAVPPVLVPPPAPVVRAVRPPAHAPRPAADLPPITSITAVTSLSPDPAQAARQRECIESWIKAGCKVVALQAAKDVIAEGDWPGVTFVRVPGSRVYPHLVPISTMARWIEANVAKGEAAMIVNADIELLIGADMLRVLAHEAATGMCIVHRHESTGQWCRTGVDAFIFRSETAKLIPTSDILTMGRPWFDWMMPYAMMVAERPLCSPAFPVLRHVSHSLRWSEEHHALGRRECVRIFGGDLRHEGFISRTRMIGSSEPYTEPQRQQVAATQSQESQYRALHPHGF